MPIDRNRAIHEIKDWLGTGSINFFGTPFAGKDTQCAQLARRVGAHILSGGAILRESAARGVLSPEHLASMNSGELIETDIFVNAVTPFLSEPTMTASPLFLSSVGRVRGEEQGVLQATAAAGHPMRAAVFLDIPASESLRRLEASPARGRDDDTLESMVTRLCEFDEKIRPVLAVYESLGLLVTVDAMSQPDIVFDTVARSLHDYANAA
ncbi:hypothetical protein EKI60_02360 [Candidatus Saccharibacteria bacterium]|nr:MAG: hypothetical protein EKI60_02360 [Candidatus Saccharibacteria bacterium]